MKSPRYTILISGADASVVRRIDLSRWVVAIGVAALVAFPLAGGLLVGQAGRAASEAMRAEIDQLQRENDLYLAATSDLAVQVSQLQEALDELDVLGNLDPATRKAIDRLPGSVRSRALGVPAAAVRRVASEGGTVGTLRQVLDRLATRLTLVRGFFEGERALARATPTVWPVAGWLSSSYGRREDPFTGSPDFHAGIDISANRGTPVHAPADGVVESSGVNGDFGRSILIGHRFGLSTRFGHLSSIAVRAGQRVQRGDVIGYVGSSGRATSSHLHFEVLLNGATMNPLRLLARP